MGAQSRWTSITTGPFEVSRFTLNTSGAFSDFLGRAASFLGSGDPHPISATEAATTAHPHRVIMEEYAMPVRRFRVVLRPLLERRVPRHRLPHSRPYLAAARARGRAHPRRLLRHRLPGPPAR